MVAARNQHLPPEKLGEGKRCKFHNECESIWCNEGKCAKMESVDYCEDDECSKNVQSFIFAFAKTKKV